MAVYPSSPIKERGTKRIFLFGCSSCHSYERGAVKSMSSEESIENKNDCQNVTKHVHCL